MREEGGEARVPPPPRKIKKKTKKMEATFTSPPLVGQDPRDFLIYNSYFLTDADLFLKVYLHLKRTFDLLMQSITFCYCIRPLSCTSSRSSLVLSRYLFSRGIFFLFLRGVKFVSIIPGTWNLCSFLAHPCYMIYRDEEANQSTTFSVEICRSKYSTISS